MTAPAPVYSPVPEPEPPEPKPPAPGVGAEPVHVRLHPDDIVAIARALNAERNRLMSLKELALAIGVPYSTLQHKTRIPFHLVGRRGAKRYNVEEVLASFRREGQQGKGRARVKSRARKDAARLVVGGRAGIKDKDKA